MWSTKDLDAINNRINSTTIILYIRVKLSWVLLPLILLDKDMDVVKWQSFNISSFRSVNSSIYGCEYLHQKKYISVVAKKDVDALTYVYLEDS